jgi:hypothetical protein
MRLSQSGNRTSSSVLIYVILLVSFQVFLLTIAVEAFADDSETLAWSSATVSVVVAGAAIAFLRYLRT